MPFIDPDTVPEKRNFIDPDEQEKPGKDYTLSEVPGQAVKSFVPGMLDYIKTFFDPQTYKNLAKSTELLSPYEKTEEGYYRKKQVPKEILSAVSKNLYEKYGSYENIKRTAAEKPQELLGDISTAISGLGGITGVSKIGAAGRVLEPLNIMTAPLKAIPKLIPQSAETRLYASAIKGLTNPKLSWTEKQNIVKKGIIEGIFPTERGLQKLNNKIEALNNKFDEIVIRESKAGAMVKSDTVLGYLDELEDFYSAMPDPTDDLAAISKIKKEFLASHGMEIGAKSKLNKIPKNIDTGLVDASGKPIIRTIYKDEIMNIPGKKEIPADEAMTIKRAAYAKYKDAYGGLTTAAKEANKDIARGIKEEFIKMNPELRIIGQNESVMIKLEEAIEAGMKRSQNYDIGRFPGLMAAGATGAATGSGKAAAIAYMAKTLIDRPIVKSALAIALNRAKKIGFGPKIPTTLRQSIFQAGQLPNQMEE